MPKTADIKANLTEVSTFVMVSVSMTLSLSLIPLFPVESSMYILPTTISLLIAYVTVKNPRTGMTIGSVLIGSALIAHLCIHIQFFQALGQPQLRALAMLTFFCVVLFLPRAIRTHEEATAISIGIFAATLLFFQVSYFIAIPLILSFAVLYRKAPLGLTLSYYTLISVPLQIMEYALRHGGSDMQDWPLYVALPTVRNRISGLMEEVTFSEIYDEIIKPIIDSILGKGGSIPLSGLLDSLPGVIVFLIIISSLVSVSVFITLIIIKGLKRVEGLQSFVKYFEVLPPVISVFIAASLFWFLLVSLEESLSYYIEIGTTQIALGTLTTVMVTLPISFVNHLLELKLLIEKRSKALVERAGILLRELANFEGKLRRVTEKTPMVVTSVKGKMLLIRDKLQDIIRGASAGIYDMPGLDEKFQEIREELKGDVEELPRQLDGLLNQYHSRLQHKSLRWTSKLEELGLEEVQPGGFTDNFDDMQLEEKIDLIAEELEEGEDLAGRLTDLFKQIYGIVRSLFDPELPAKSPTVAYVEQIVEDQESPWLEVEAVYKALVNMDKHFGTEIGNSIQALKRSTSPLVDLASKHEKLSPVLGDSLPQVKELTEELEGIKSSPQASSMEAMKVLDFRRMLHSTLHVTRRVFSILYDRLKKKENMIREQLPTTDYDWGENSTLLDRLERGLQVVSESSEHDVNEVLDNLNDLLAHMDECLATIGEYDRTYELLLNYPVAKKAIRNLMQKDDEVQAQDLPFKREASEEYLQLYSIQNYREVSLDDKRRTLIRRP